MAAFYQSVDKNLEALSEVSAEIREEAILPSFTMFKERTSVFKEKLAALRDLEFA